MTGSAYKTFLEQRAQNGQLRTLQPVGPSWQGSIQKNQQSLINFSSNNYLGLANHPLLIARAQEWTAQWGTGATASRLVCGNLELFEQVETRLAHGKNTAAALVFNSGFQANMTILAALLDPVILRHPPLVFCDRLNHASLHHGCRLAGARQIRYRHNDLNHLEFLLKKNAQPHTPRFILTESVFSMDGDQADVAGLIELKYRYGAFLYLDEAHATGVLGPNGFGLGAQHANDVDLIMGTFSKGLGGFGAYAACSLELRQYLINHCAGLIYSTALPPGVLGAMDAALTLLPTLGQTREALLTNAAQLRQQLAALGLNTGTSSTQIIPIILGKEESALTMSQMLEKKEAILAMAIRPPTVPIGTARLRISLTADHGEQQRQQLIHAVRRIANTL
ncbi:MAG: 8-amino-7-oxononanoate synthase [Magnetococcales bacterium]|nr:8-amino-7-oxononanoate synthase [Magnetococcales bacterium]MBF0439040.1 8-amino-7-oxononanoate synthase [Magnetococcales bacterium]